KSGGMIGNIYSMGLALQALESTQEFYAPREWNSTQACNMVYSHDYRLPMAIAQVLPPLVGRSYLDAADLNCTTGTMLPDLCAPQHHGGCPSCLSPLPTDIEVHYTITNTLQGTPFSYTTTVQVPAGSVLLRVLQAAQEKDPDIFSFQTKQTFWGPMVISIHGLAADLDQRTYWEFLSGGVPLQEGVGTYKPRDGEHIQANFTTY
ncbi:IF factor, partial [Caloenas nicobarica]|nr:IF factor [Caloenas nicobarica]